MLYRLGFYDVILVIHPQRIDFRKSPRKYWLSVDCLGISLNLEECDAGGKVAQIDKEGEGIALFSFDGFADVSDVEFRVGDSF